MKLQIGCISDFDLVETNCVLSEMIFVATLISKIYYYTEEIKFNIWLWFWLGSFVKYTASLLLKIY